ncbi:hypothetical protein QO058_27210 [Bosea vestrisii]|uniref:hypothetical protein n=1 Tax=Bosea vestrisii TaxID=151416 RepID=UPI0024E02266|nr:hypothetical protein [Bosea vestrisii]WID96370.1 hypothetical protein QO058_27210 [Bosea vestrisii]
MMFQLFEAIADRVRDQAADYADAQARIGARTLAHVVDPFNMTSAMVESSPASALTADADLHPPRPRSARRAKRNSGPAVKRPSRPSRRPAANFA